MRTRSFSELAEQILAEPVRRARVGKHKRTIREALALADSRAEADQSQRDGERSRGQSPADGSRPESGEER